MPDRQNKPDIHRSEQGTLNWSFDEIFKVLAVMQLGYDGQNAVRTSSDSMNIRYDPAGYVGEAAPGTAEDAENWRIYKFDTSSGVSITYAEGQNAFDKVWDDRAGYTYS